MRCTWGLAAALLCTLCDQICLQRPLIAPTHAPTYPRMWPALLARTSLPAEACRAALRHAALQFRAESGLNTFGDLTSILEEAPRCLLDTLRISAIVSLYAFLSA